MITTKWTPELQERIERVARWQVTLSDGRTVYQVDEDGEDWKSLRKYLLENPEIHITKMFVGFRSNCIPLRDNAEGYFFRCSILATPGWEKKSYIVGVVYDGALIVNKYELPEMIDLGQERRDIEEAGESLIFCKGNKDGKLE